VCLCVVGAPGSCAPRRLAWAPGALPGAAAALPPAGLIPALRHLGHLGREPPLARSGCAPAWARPLWPSGPSLPPGLLDWLPAWCVCVGGSGSSPHAAAAAAAPAWRASPGVPARAAQAQAPGPPCPLRRRAAPRWRWRWTGCACTCPSSSCPAALLRPPGRARRAARSGSCPGLRRGRAAGVSRRRAAWRQTSCPPQSPQRRRRRTLRGACREKVMGLHPPAPQLQRTTRRPPRPGSCSSMQVGCCCAGCSCAPLAPAQRPAVPGQLHGPAEFRPCRCSPAEPWPGGQGQAAQRRRQAARPAWQPPQAAGLRCSAGGDGGASGDDDDAASSSSGSDYDDLELWADPREVARRRQERARAKVPPEQRRCVWVGGGGGALSVLKHVAHRAGGEAAWLH
jgi:hypothetical protein